ncbi:MAG: phenylalanine--tRNA ligase subunit beta [Planctomycetes bacterium]|nr:phenylalanine--tRNA ligase subunit beta [Planctomycetota bacterium]
MRVSLNWVTRLLGKDSLGISNDELLSKLIAHVAEIEEIDSTGPSLDGVVIGKILTCEQHPNADRLRVCTVDVAGESPLPIVCGAPNVAAGQKVAVATIGCTLEMIEDGQIKPFTIKKGKLRGEASHGMICAEDELGLGNSHDGIMVLDEGAEIGAPLTSALSSGDHVLIVDNHNINHRPDLWGHIGWAREIAVLLETDFSAAIDTSFNPQGNNWSVDIQDDNCVTYCGAVVEGVDNRQSPEWMQEVLNAAGVRPLGLLVDITNYVMLELGEPMHAFDRRHISGEKITVRNAQEKEPFTTLDGSEHQLNNHDLLITDNDKALALAGIMGGADSMVSDDTTCIVLEAAIFKPGAIRRTRISSGVASESSNRFEKGLYPCMAAAAINRAIALLQEIIPECTVSDKFSQGAVSSEQRILNYDYNLVRSYLGVDISDQTQDNSLQALGFEKQGNQWLVPWWRHKDIEASIDFVEEVARFYGYQQLPAEVPRLPASSPQRNHLRESEHRCRSIMSAQSWDEVMCYAFSSDVWAQTLQWDESKVIHLDHPLSSEQTVMRLDLLPNLFEAALRNRRHFSQVRLYEIGKRYGQNINQAPCVDEIQCIAGIICEQGNDTPFYDARDAALNLLTSLGYDAAYAVSDVERIGLLASRSIELKIGKHSIGYVSEIADDLRKKHKCKDRVAYFHIELENIVCNIDTPRPVSMNTPSKYQEVEREFTWVCPENALYADIETAVKKASGKLCQGVELITVYRGDQIEDSHKAVSMRVLLQSADHTLSEKELSKFHKKIVSTVEHTTTAKLRS